MGTFIVTEIGEYKEQNCPEPKVKLTKLGSFFSVELCLFGVVWLTGNTSLNRWFHSVTGIGDKSVMKANGSIIENSD